MDTLKRLRELAEKATPGPWHWDGDVCTYDHEQEAPWLINAKDNPVLRGEIDCDNSWTAELIAALSPDMVLRLIACIEAAKKMRVEPHGCRFCDSGKLRRPNDLEKEHDPDCGFLMFDAARAALDEEPR